MKPIRLFRHINCSAPGYLGQFLENNGIPFEIACINNNTQVPDTLDDISGLVIMGGPGDVNSPWSHRKFRYLKSPRIEYPQKVLRLARSN